MAPDDKAGYVSTTTAQDLLADLRNEMLREVLLERLRLRQLQHQGLLLAPTRIIVRFCSTLRRTLPVITDCFLYFTVQLNVCLCIDPVQNNSQC